MVTLPPFDISRTPLPLFPTQKFSWRFKLLAKPSTTKLVLTHRHPKPLTSTAPKDPASSATIPFRFLIRPPLRTWSWPWPVSPTDRVVIPVCIIYSDPASSTVTNPILLFTRLLIDGVEIHRSASSKVDWLPQRLKLEWCHRWKLRSSRKKKLATKSTKETKGL